MSSSRGREYRIAPTSLPQLRSVGAPAPAKPELDPILGVERAQPLEVLDVINLPAGIALGQQLDRRVSVCCRFLHVGVLAP